MWHNFVALGDSFTEGVGDPVEGIELMGWADCLVRGFRQKRAWFSYTNLAKRGLTIGEVREQQLQKALALHPDLVSIMAGANDILKGQWNVEQYEADMDFMFRQFAERGTTILTATISDMAFLPVSSRHRERLDRHLSEANQIVKNLSRRYEAVWVDFWKQPASLEIEFWSADRLHPNAFGYTKIAELLTEALHVRANQLVKG